MIVDISFAVHGGVLPTDHGYHLFCGISKIYPWFHNDPGIFFNRVTGYYIGDGKLSLVEGGSLTFRTPHDKIGMIEGLVGRKLKLFKSTIYIGVTTGVEMITPSAELYSRIVVTRNGKEKDYKREITKQISAISAGSSFELEFVKERCMMIRGAPTRGYEILLKNLEETNSLAIQEYGIGGRRKMGAGFFIKRRTNERN